MMIITGPAFVADTTVSFHIAKAVLATIPGTDSVLTIATVESRVAGAAALDTDTVARTLFPVFINRTRIYAETRRVGSE